MTSWTHNHLSSPSTLRATLMCTFHMPLTRTNCADVMRAEAKLACRVISHIRRSLGGLLELREGLKHNNPTRHITFSNKEGHTPPNDVTKHAPPRNSVRMHLLRNEIKAERRK